MLDVTSARRNALRRNIERCSRLLETELTSIERGNLHKRMAEDWAVLSRLNQSADGSAADGSHGAQPSQPPEHLERRPSEQGRSD
jgi:hypothetical protein